MDKKTALETVINFLENNVPEDQLPDVEAIFVFGHIDPRVAKHAAYLYNLKKARRVIVTGKGHEEIPGYEDEAQYFRDVMKDEGVPEMLIILEEQAMNTLENVRFGIEAASKAAIQPKTLILVAIPPLLRRAQATFAKQFPEIITYCNSFQMPVTEYETYLKRLLAEFDRMKDYAKKGDVDEVPIPGDVANAVAFLKTLPEAQTTSAHFFLKNNAL